jgi:hypothetical protein
MEITGGCLCGAVRYRATSAPLVVRVCYCRTCQFLGAGDSTVNLAFRSADFSSQGTLSDYRSVADSGRVMHRRFCPACGTPLYSEAEERPHLIIVRAGSLDDRELVKPDANIWTASAPSWACRNVSLPEFTHQPPPAA